MKKFANLLGLMLATMMLLPSETIADEGDVVKTFILAGQSNMEGKAKNSLLEQQATDSATKSLFEHLRVDGKWIVRDDVFVKFLERHGPLTIGYGSPDRTGVELEFGNVMGNHFEEPVLLIKTAWGGHSLFQLFRSPSAGVPSDDQLQSELAEARARVEGENEKHNRNQPLPTLDEIKANYGSSYRNMISEIHDVTENLDMLFPELGGKKIELTGFVWFQGWNDQYGAQDEYASNMKHFINDVRAELKSPSLPVVIGVMGQNGSKPAEGAMLTIQQAQLSMHDVPEFRGNVTAIRTDELVDTAAEKLYPHWKERTAVWERTGSDHGYHYLGSAIWFNRIGKSMGQAMVELLERPAADQP